MLGSCCNKLDGGQACDDRKFSSHTIMMDHIAVASTRQKTTCYPPYTSDTDTSDLDQCNGGPRHKLLSSGCDLRVVGDASHLHPARNNARQR